MKRLLVLVAATAVPAIAAAQTPAAPATVSLERGKQIATQVCAACHGADGNSPTPANPNLAGQHADYITVQLAHFKAGIRVNPIMQGMAAGLSDDDMRSLGMYFAQQKPKGLVAKSADLAKAGQAMWRAGDMGTGVPACSSCHSPTGAGIPKNYPRLAGQYADYTYTQLRAFKTGERGADKGSKDAGGRIMRGVVEHMTDEQMKAVADYAAGLR
ncbi:MAG TPA: c-type cytochrome [Casimicrobiaceae bacterium]|nr:c-type cytochrome [Casimicrobiaceae bacterium]